VSDSEAPASSPVVYWMQGGPGADDEFGLFAEMGPVLVEMVNGTAYVAPRDESWTWCPPSRRCLFMDQPVFTGFSFARDVSGIPPTLVESTAQVEAALVQIYSLFPDLSSGPLVVTGESYGGKYVPALGASLAARFAAGASPAIPLRAIPTTTTIFPASSIFLPLFPSLRSSSTVLRFCRSSPIPQSVGPQRSLSVVRLSRAKRTATIRNRKTIFGSFQPSISK
jgi:carboxypeptidase C (cathepsin A)